MEHRAPHRPKLRIEGPTRIGIEILLTNWNGMVDWAYTVALDDFVSVGQSLTIKRLTFKRQQRLFTETCVRDVHTKLFCHAKVRNANHIIIIR